MNDDSHLTHSSIVSFLALVVITQYIGSDFLQKLAARTEGDLIDGCFSPRQKIGVKTFASAFCTVPIVVFDALTSSLVMKFWGKIDGDGTAGCGEVGAKMFEIRFSFDRRWWRVYLLPSFVQLYISVIM